MARIGKHACHFPIRAIRAIRVIRGFLIPVRTVEFG